jgi:tRNA pseudouridine55 synthase
MDSGGDSDRSSKAYECEARLGVTTDTLDIWGRVTPASGAGCARPEITPERVRDVFASLAGDVEQTPPAYSAVKYKGKKLYEYARRGEEIPADALRPRRVWIESIEVSDVVMDSGDGAARGDEGFATVRFAVVCGRGVYVRSIVRDAGAALGCGAAMSALVRTKSGVFTLSDSHTKDEAERAAAEGRLSDLMLPADAAISFMPAVDLDGARRGRFVNGAPVRAAAGIAGAEATRCVRVYSGGALLGVGDFSDGIIKPRKVLAT